ncbi:MAG: tRNA-(guanine-N1)-methyltransferase, partial [Rhodomicrobium sp.]
VHGHSVTCPLHNWVIGLATGEAQGADKGSVKTVPLKREGGRLLLDAKALWLGRGE